MTDVLQHKSIMYIDDPNNINVNTNLINSIPQYQDMHIYAELTAVRKDRSVITIGDEIETDDTFKVNFIGVNQNTDSPNNLSFSTNYYDGSTSSNEKQMESFGISNIKVKVNSSYVPEINIQFIDFRGLSFFNQENSPYRILFDFPPPIFNLKIKGYYGRTLEYNIHLVKYNTEFISDNGNFVIDAQFVALTFAPLTDILFRYITNMPLVVNDESLFAKTNEKPKNTYELILKIQNLYSEVSKKLDKSEDKIKYDEVLMEYNNIESSINLLKNYDIFLKEKGTPILFTKETKTDYTPLIPILDNNGNLVNGLKNETNGEITTLKNLNEYNSIIKSHKDYINPDGIKNRLFVGYLMASNSSKQNEFLLNFKNRLLSNDIVEDNTVKGPEIVNELVSSISIPQKSYLVLDITTFYVELYRKKLKSIEKRKILSKSINTVINNSILENLGMIPTIYNIFEIILNDVDKFFNILKETSKSAEEHHNELINEIRDRIAPNDNIQGSEYLYPFPLIIKNKDGHCFNTQVRTSPKEINEVISKPFPESTLITAFIDTFNKQKQFAIDFKARTNTNSDGTAIWIPISPLDSSLGDVSPITPYVGRVGNIDSILEILLERFYILTQFSIPADFYDENDVSNPSASKYYNDFFSYSEALNIALSVNNKDVSNDIITFAKKYNTNNKINNFYIYLKNNNKIITNYDNLKNYYVLDNVYYSNKNNNGYRGTNIYLPDIQLQNVVEDNSNPLSVFINDVNNKKNGVGWFWNRNKLPEASYSFTKENVLYIKDTPTKKGVISENNNVFNTRYLTNTHLIENIGEFKTNKVDSKKIYEGYVNILITEGNSGFNKIPNTNKRINFNSNDNFIANNFVNLHEVWYRELGKNDIYLYDKVINDSSNLSAILILSNFGFTLSAFNLYPKYLNTAIFQTPAAVEVPVYVALYIGSLVGVNNNITLLNELNNYFISGSGYNLTSKGFYIFADIFDINNYLSNNDKAYYKNLYDNWYSDGGYNNIRETFKKLYDEVNSNPSNITNSNFKRNTYENLLMPQYAKVLDNKKNYYNNILAPLLERKNIIIYSQNTFKRNITNNNTVFQPLEIVNNDGNKKMKNDRFFVNFFNKLIEILTKKNEEDDEENEYNNTIGDEDITTQLYYSFKNINDKWLSNPNKNFGNSDGYPSNRNGRRLIDSFAFIDRAMNPIGDTIINPEILLDLFEDTDVSVFGVISQLLSRNGFEFFPLQNFMTHSRESWGDSFKIDASGLVTKRDAFVCMYIGGTSSYPSNISKNGFVNDGIIDITTTNAIDFNDETNNCNSNFERDRQVEKNVDFPYQQVRAFRVKFGEQNQSMFKDIKIDSKEFPETNESLQILSRLAGDQKESKPVPKGQNLYNLYENRAYSATITGLGNAMIQPTQYFQLDNVPLFNGAYLILSVEHDITANKMSTTFSGTKILKYPIPRVMNPAAVIGFDIGSSDITDWNAQPDSTPTTDNGNGNLLPENTINNNIIQLNAPINPTQTRISGVFGEDRGNHEHKGIDFAAPAGTEIWAVASGVVIVKYNSTSYGNNIIIDHGNNEYSLYAHMLDNSPNIEIGQNVDAGQIIGHCGDSGSLGSVHLHFEYRIGDGGGNKDGTIYAVDPRPYLEESMKYNWISFDKRNVT